MQVIAIFLQIKYTVKVLNQRVHVDIHVHVLKTSKMVTWRNVYKLAKHEQRDAYPIILFENRYILNLKMNILM